MSECNRCGLCCKYLKVTIENLTEDERRYLENHNKCYIHGNSLLILVMCKHLKHKNSKYICDVHNTVAYPEACKKGECLLKTNKEEAEFVKAIMKERGK